MEHPSTGSPRLRAGQAGQVEHGVSLSHSMPFKMDQGLKDYGQLTFDLGKQCLDIIECSGQT